MTNNQPQRSKTERARIATASIMATTLLLSISGHGHTGGGGVTGGATEWTQLANNAEFISLVGNSAEQINNQVTQITQFAEQIQNQLKIYKNMVQNTAQLPNHVWGQVESDLNRLQGIVAQGQGIAFSMGNVDDVLKQRFQSFSEFKKSGSGKTTVAIILAGEFARHGYSTAIVDADPQGSSYQWHASSVARGLSPEGVDLVRAVDEKALTQAIERLDRYDVVVVDTPDY